MFMVPGLSVRGLAICHFLYVTNHFDCIPKVVNYMYLYPITQIRLPLSALTFRCLSSADSFKRKKIQ